MSFIWFSTLFLLPPLSSVHFMPVSYLTYGSSWTLVFVIDALYIFIGTDYFFWLGIYFVFLLLFLLLLFVWIVNEWQEMNMRNVTFPIIFRWVSSILLCFSYRTHAKNDMLIHHIGNNNIVEYRSIYCCGIQKGIWTRTFRAQPAPHKCTKCSQKCVYCFCHDSRQSISCFIY